MKYGKVRFISKFNGNTAGIVLTDKQQENLTIAQVSDLFPRSESMKMEKLQRSDYFDTFEQAFSYQFEY